VEARFQFFTDILKLTKAVKPFHFQADLNHPDLFAILNISRPWQKIHRLLLEGLVFKFGTHYHRTLRGKCIQELSSPQTVPRFCIPQGPAESICIYMLYLLYTAVSVNMSENNHVENAQQQLNSKYERRRV
jgi:hypothetical protein